MEKRIIFRNLILVVFSILILGCEKDKPIDLNKDKNPLNPLLSLEFLPEFAGESLSFSTRNFITPANDTIKFTRLRLLLSDLSLQKEDGTWESMDTFLYVSMDEGKTKFDLTHIFSNESYQRIKFTIGLDSSVNHGDPQRWHLGHPLNPLTNGMHWGWLGGYIFMITEGYYHNSGDSLRMMSFHMATLPYRKEINIEIPGGRKLNSGSNTLQIGVDMSRYFSSPNPYSLIENGPSSHSGSPAEMERMSLLFANLSTVFSIKP